MTLWDSRLASLIEEYIIRHPAQSAYIKGRDTVRTGLGKIIVNDQARIYFLTNILVDLDASIAFDRLTPHEQTLTTCRNGMPSKPVNLPAKLIHNARHHIATAHGISKGTYTSTKEIPVDGSGQGGANSNLSYNNSSNLFLDCMDANNKDNAVLYHAAYRMGNRIKIRMHTNQYADDTSLHAIKDITNTPTDHTKEARAVTVKAVANNTKNAIKDATKILPLLGGNFNTKGW